MNLLANASIEGFHDKPRIKCFTMFIFTVRGLESERRMLDAEPTLSHSAALALRLALGLRSNTQLGASRIIDGSSRQNKHSVGR